MAPQLFSLSVLMIPSTGVPSEGSPPCLTMVDVLQDGLIKYVSEQSIILEVKINDRKQSTHRSHAPADILKDGEIISVIIRRVRKVVRTGEISDFGHVPKQAYFSEPCCDQTTGHSNNQWVPNEKFGHNLSIKTLWFPILQIVYLTNSLSTQPVKVGHFSKNKNSTENHNLYLG